MFLEQYAGELIAFATGIAGVIIGKITNRKKDKADIKELEVRITDKLLKIIMDDVVEPLREELAITRKELERFKNAYKKRHTCRSNADCPITVELQKPENSKRKPVARKRTTNRQREPDGGEDDEAPGDTADDSSPES
jgi:hypothetical protein